MNKITSISNQRLYFFLMVSTGALFIISMGAGLFGDSSSIYSWQHKIFEVVCHQDAFRSYSINGAPMAVCARCFGIYTSLFLGLILAPLIIKLSFFNRKTCVQLLVVSVVLNFADVIANAMSIYSNTLHSRFLLGAFFGLTIMMFLADEFFKTNFIPEDLYGTTNRA